VARPEDAVVGGGGGVAGGRGVLSVAELEAGVEQTASDCINKKSSFAIDVLKLVSGATLAQALSVLVTPVFSRLFSPEAFGTAAVFGSIVAIVGVVACLRYDAAIMLPKRDEEATNLLAVSLFFTLVVAVLSAASVLLVRESLVRLLNTPDLAPYLWLVPASVLANGGFVALNYWNSRTRHFGRLSIAKASRSFVMNGAQLGLGAAGQAHAGAMIGSSVLSSTIITTLLGGQTWRDDGRLLRQSINWQDMVAGIKRYRKFPLYSTWSALLNSVSWQLPFFLLSAFFSSTVAGYYALGTRLLRLPMNFIGNAIAQVFFQRAAEAKVEGTLATVVESVFRRLVMVGLFPMLLLTFIGQDLFVVVFGDNWAEAGVYTQILSVWMFFQFISAPLFTLINVIEKQEYGLIFNILTFIARFVALWIGGSLGNVYIALILFAISGLVTYGGLALTLMAASGIPWSKSGRILFSNFALFIPAGIFMAIIKFPGAHSIIQLGVACVILGIYLTWTSQNQEGFDLC